jgi:type II secretory pathway component GspD/PulD (secretin)
MPDSADRPIAYSALQPGTPVRTRDGQEFATVQSVLVDEKVSVFDGIVVQTTEGARFVDADQIGTIYTTYVSTTLSADQTANLPPPDGSNLIDIKPPRSMADRLSRMIGRRKR